MLEISLLGTTLPMESFPNPHREPSARNPRSRISSDGVPSKPIPGCSVRWIMRSSSSVNRHPDPAEYRSWVIQFYSGIKYPRVICNEGIEFPQCEITQVPVYGICGLTTRGIMTVGTVSRNSQGPTARPHISLGQLPRFTAGKERRAESLIHRRMMQNCPGK